MLTCCLWVPLKVFKKVKPRFCPTKALSIWKISELNGYLKMIYTIWHTGINQVCNNRTGFFIYMAYVSMRFSDFHYWYDMTSIISELFSSELKCIIAILQQLKRHGKITTASSKSMNLNMFYWLISLSTINLIDLKLHFSDW